MGRREVPFDIQYLILLKVSSLDEFNRPKSDWDHVVNCLCVCRAWKSTLQDLLICYNSPWGLLRASKPIGQLAIEKTIAFFLARREARRSGAARVPIDPPVNEYYEIIPGDVDDDNGLLEDDLENCIAIVCCMGHVDIVRYGLDCGLPDLIPDFEMERPMAIAMDNNQLEVLKLLVERGIGDINANASMEDNSALAYCVHNERVEMVQYLLEQGADRNIRIRHFVTDYEHSLSPVLFAAWCNNTELMRVLLEHGLPVEDPEYDLRPIYWAIMKDNLESVRMLVEYGVDLSPSEYDTVWPLHAAVSFGRADIVRFLLGKCGELKWNEEDERMREVVERCKNDEIKGLFRGLLS